MVPVDFCPVNARLPWLDAVLSRGYVRRYATAERETSEVRGLYVSDAASLPGNTGANPQVTIMANALRIADAIATREAAA